MYSYFNVVPLGYYHSSLVAAVLPTTIIIPLSGMCNININYNINIIGTQSQNVTLVSILYPSVTHALFQRQIPTYCRTAAQLNHTHFENSHEHSHVELSQCLTPHCFRMPSHCPNRSILINQSIQSTHIYTGMAGTVN